MPDNDFVGAGGASLAAPAAVAVFAAVAIFLLNAGEILAEGRGTRLQ